MQVVVLLLLVAGLALLVLGLITASTPLVLASAAASLLAGYAISRYRRRQPSAPAAGAAGSTAEAPVAARTSAAVTVAELAHAVAAERAAAGEPTTALPAVARGESVVAAEPVARTDSVAGTESVVPAERVAQAVPAHAESPQAVPAHAVPAVRAEPAHAASASADQPVGGSALLAGVADPARPDGSAGLDAEADQAEVDDPPVADTDPPLRSRGAEPVWVIDGRPRYHLAGCDFLSDRVAEPVPLRQAFEDGFTPCGWCDPDTGLSTG